MGNRYNSTELRGYIDDDFAKLSQPEKQIMKDLLDNIRIVLVHTSHPGNIGAVARAMKTMSLRHLYLVQPKLFPDATATARAKQAEDILARAVVVNTLPEAIADCSFVLGTSVRPRTLAWP